MTEEQQKRKWATIWVCVALYVVLSLWWYGWPTGDTFGFMVGGLFAGGFGWWISLIVNGADLFIGDYHRVVNRKRPDDE